MLLEIDFPDRFADGATPTALARRVKLYAAIGMFAAGELSAGAACEVAGVDRMTFVAACARLSIPTINYSPEDLKAEYEALLASANGERR